MKSHLSNMTKLAIRIPDIRDGKNLVCYLSSEFKNERRQRERERVREACCIVAMDRGLGRKPITL